MNCVSCSVTDSYSICYHMTSWPADADILAKTFLATVQYIYKKNHKHNMYSLKSIDFHIKDGMQNHNFQIQNLLKIDNFSVMLLYFW